MVSYTDTQPVIPPITGGLHCGSPIRGLCRPGYPVIPPISGGLHCCLAAPADVRQGRRTVPAGSLLADEAHRLAGRELASAGLGDEDRKETLPVNGAATGHRHAHWIPLADLEEEPQFVRYLVVWVPCGLRARQVTALLSLREMSGRRGRALNGYEVRG
jgi:hypothetical protein